MAKDKSKTKQFDLGADGTVKCHLSDDGTRLLIEFEVDNRGFSKSGLNGFIDALKKTREKMVR